VGPPLPPEPPPEAGWTETGEASWYGPGFHGRTTASGETYDMEAMTAAHQSLPFGTLVHVENLDNRLATTVRINDRGPFVGGRIIDLSRRAAREIEMIGPGTAEVRLTLLEVPAAQSCWRVQAGAFRDRDNARALVSRLQAEELEAEVSPAGGGLHRVLVGPFESREDAGRVAAEVGGHLAGC